MRTCTGMIIIKVRFVFLWVFFFGVWRRLSAYEESGEGGRPMIRAVALTSAGCCDSFNECLIVRSSTPTPMKLM